MGDGTSIGRVRGLGAAHEGARHWWHQRLTAGANLVLMVWFFAALLFLPDFQYKTLVEWIAQPLVAVPLILLVANVFYHIRLGLQVVIEDYLHGAEHIVFMVALNFAVIAGAALSIFSILKIAFTAGAAS